MTEPLTGYEANSVAEIGAILDDSPADADEVYLRTIGHSERAIAAVAAKRAGSGGGGSMPLEVVRHRITPDSPGWTWDYGDLFGATVPLSIPDGRIALSSLYRLIEDFGAAGVPSEAKLWSGDIGYPLLIARSLVTTPLGDPNPTIVHNTISEGSDLFGALTLAPVNPVLVIQFPADFPPTAGALDYYLVLAVAELP